MAVSGEERRGVRRPGPNTLRGVCSRRARWHAIGASGLRQRPWLLRPAPPPVRRRARVSCPSASCGAARAAVSAHRRPRRVRRHSLAECRGLRVIEYRRVLPLAGLFLRVLSALAVQCRFCSVWMHRLLFRAIAEPGCHSTCHSAVESPSARKSSLLSRKGLACNCTTRNRTQKSVAAVS